MKPAPNSTGAPTAPTSPQQGNPIEGLLRSNDTPAAARPVCDWDLYHLQFTVLAAQALLERAERWDTDNTLTGVHYLLTGIAERCEEIGGRMPARSGS